jgi:hypothetical protein
MKSKMTGYAGEAAVVKYLLKKNYPVFKEFGDSSKIDLITIVNNRCYKIQVKTIEWLGNNGSLVFSTFKSGRNSYFYTESDVDVFAVYNSEIDDVIFIGWNDLKDKKNLTIRFKKSLNNQNKNINWYEDYKDFDRLINPG